MFMVRGKKGQEGLTLTTLLLLIVGLAVAVLLILGFTFGWSYIFGKIKFLPGQDLQAITESCKVSANTQLKNDFCQFKQVDVDGKTQLLNCESPKLTGQFDAPQFSCGQNVVIEKCNSLSSKDYDSMLLNGKLCAELGVQKVKCEDIKSGANRASWSASCIVATQKDVTSQVQDTTGKTAADKVCCLTLDTTQAGK